METKKRAERSDKKIRVNPSLDKDTHAKLKRLAVACDMPKTKLAEEILKIAVNNPSLIGVASGKCGFTTISLFS